MHDWLQERVCALHAQASAAARQRQTELTKPPGSLGRLEPMAIRWCAMRGEPELITRCGISVFAADHGVGAAGVSAYPQAVTAQMLHNFSQGGAAINVLAEHLAAELEVINLGTIQPLPALAGVIHRPIAAGTRNFCAAPAMTPAQRDSALLAGKAAIQRAQKRHTQLFIGGEMGIANTTSATAMACALLQAPPAQLVGPGTGLKAAGIAHKSTIIQQALDYHQAHLEHPLDILQRLGGFEIVALCGAYVHAAQCGMAVMVDGFIASVAALCAVRLQAEVAAWLFFAHASAEPGHQHILAALAAEPILALNLRLGEGSGAALAVPILQLAVKLHRQMATFSHAGVATHEA